MEVVPLELDPCELLELLFDEELFEELDELEEELDELELFELELLDDGLDELLLDELEELLLELLEELLFELLLDELEDEEGLFSEESFKEDTSELFSLFLIGNGSLNVHPDNKNTADKPKTILPTFIIYLFSFFSIKK